jgi:hypothetical protein
MGENLALREILNKTLNENNVLETKKEEIIKIEEPKKEEPKHISLNDLKAPRPSISSPLQDRSASSDDMNRLKDLIIAKTDDTEATIVLPEVEQEINKKEEMTTFVPKIPEEKIIEKIEEVKKEEYISAPAVEPVERVPQAQAPQHQAVSPNGKVREVPEDILRKILE